MRNAALRLAELGYAVCPCEPGGKALLRPRGKIFTTSPEVVREWWGQTPTANLAIRTAELLVVDVDRPRDLPPKWLTWLPERETDWLRGVAGAVDRSGGGGRHYFFRSPEGIMLPTQRLDGTHVDLLKGGGWVLVTPSATRKGAYRWDRPLTCRPEELPTPPDWLTARLRRIAERRDIATYSDVFARMESRHRAGWPLVEVFFGRLILNRRCRARLPPEYLSSRLQALAVGIGQPHRQQHARRSIDIEFLRA